MTKRKPTTNHDTLEWKKGCNVLLAQTGGKIVTYTESTGRYRIRHFLGMHEEPFFALIAGRGRSRAEQISRHATLEEAKAACELHLRQRSDG